VGSLTLTGGLTSASAVTVAAGGVTATAGDVIATVGNIVATDGDVTFTLSEGGATKSLRTVIAALMAFAAAEPFADIAAVNTAADTLNTAIA